ncbi:MAG: EAL domain-containing protein [Proteobacteria bacterium]|nr:EAL domain-containing protein [Pseudomonadota bacterium]
MIDHNFHIKYLWPNLSARAVLATAILTTAILALSQAEALAGNALTLGSPSPDSPSLLFTLVMGLAAIATLALLTMALRRYKNRNSDLQHEYDALVDAFNGQLYICAPDGTLEFMNSAMIKQIGRDATGEPCHKALFDLEQTCPWCVNVNLFVNEAARYEFHPNGQDRWLEAVCAPVKRQVGGVSKLVMLTDITARKEIEAQFRLSEERYRTIAEHTHAMEIWLGPQGEHRYTSPACLHITGYENEAFEKQPQLISTLLHRDDLPDWEAFLAGEASESLDFRIFRRDGAMRWMNAARHEVCAENGEALGLRLSVRDITERKQLEIQLRYQALHDPMTGLANRVLASDRIAQAVERAKRRDDYHFALAFADIDRLKVINDSFGHRVGDKALEQIAARMHKSVRSLDMVARYGSDQFIFLLEELDKPRKAINIINRARAAIEEPLIIDGHELNMSACFGAVLFPPPEDDDAELIRKANIALHLAKKAGYGKLKVFVPHMLDKAVELMTLENDLRRAVHGGEFFVEYQPILTLHDSKLIGFEALVRWNHPQRGVVSPAEFIPLAEETGLITRLGHFVLEEACQTMSTWRETMPEAQGLMLSVNLSARQFTQPDLVDSVREILKKTGMPANKLKLEITETTIMENADAATDKLNRLKSLGIQISIDDFGTGYSSMSYLQKFPLDHLKIDLSFINRMDTTPGNQEIVKAIINLAHNLGLEVVAEGVEKSSQQDILNSLNCEYGQGFLFSHAVSAVNAKAYILGDAQAQPEGPAQLIITRSDSKT